MGRPPKKTLAEKIADAQARDLIARLDDDCTVDTDLAALYLCISPRQLEDLRSGSEGPDMMKAIQKGAQGSNQPVHYKMGSLREWQRGLQASGSFDAAVKGGLAGWVSERRPFFAELDEAFNARRRDILVGDAWDARDQEREDRFARLVGGSLRVVWMTALEAASALWDDAAAHRVYAERALALLRQEAGAIDAAILHSELLAETR